MFNRLKKESGNHIVSHSRTLLLTLMAALPLLLFICWPATATPAQRTYYFPWYDNNSAWGMKGDWIIISNQGDADAVVRIYLGTGDTPVAEMNLAAAGSDGDQSQWQAPGVVTGGPVRVVSTSGQPLGVSQRVIYKDSFNEMRAIDEYELESQYVFTWYDNNPAWGMNGNWICATNLGTQSSSINVYLGDITDSATPAATLGPVEPGGHVEWQPSQTMANGPVRVASTNGQPLLASQRVLYKNSFNEVAGVGVSRLGSEAMFPWYDNNPAWGMNGNWILVANHDDNNFDPARVQISIDGTPVNDPAHPERNYFIVAAGGFITPQFTGITGGPVSVSCQNCDSGQRLIVSQRVLYKDSFEEVQGASPVSFTPPAAPGEDGNWIFPIPVPPESDGTVTLPPPNDMGDNAGFSWYDAKIANGMMGDWILIGNESNAAADVYISVGGVSMIDPASGTTTFTVEPGGIITPIFRELMGGPVRVACQNCTPGQKLIVSQRVIYQNSFNEVLGRPRS